MLLTVFNLSNYLTRRWGLIIPLWNFTFLQNVLHYSIPCSTVKTSIPYCTSRLIHDHYISVRRTRQHPKACSEIPAPETTLWSSPLLAEEVVVRNQTRPMMTTGCTKHSSSTLVPDRKHGRSVMTSSGRPLIGPCAGV